MDSNKQLRLQNLPSHNDFEITRFDYLLCPFLNMWYSFHQKPACLGKSLMPFPLSLAFPSLWEQEGAGLGTPSAECCLRSQGFIVSISLKRNLVFAVVTKIDDVFNFYLIFIIKVQSALGFSNPGAGE